MHELAPNVLLLSPKQRLASILKGSGDPICLHRSTNCGHALESLARRRVDILCLDCDHPATTSFLRKVPLKEVVRCYFVIAVTNDAAVRRRLEKRDVQYLATHHQAHTEIPHLLKFCIGLLRMERRRNARVAVYLPVVVSEAKSERSFRATVTELSETGCRIFSQLPMEIAAQLNLCLHMQDSGAALTASATVVWSDGIGQAGLAFTYIDPPEYLRYRDWLSQLHSGHPDSHGQREAHRMRATHQPLNAGLLFAATEEFGDF